MYNKQERPARPAARRDVAAAAHDATHIPEWFPDESVAALVARGRVGGGLRGRGRSL